MTAKDDKLNNLLTALRECSDDADAMLLALENTAGHTGVTGHTARVREAVHRTWRVLDSLNSGDGLDPDAFTTSSSGELMIEREGITLRARVRRQGQSDYGPLVGLAWVDVDGVALEIPSNHPCVNRLQFWSVPESLWVEWLRAGWSAEATLSGMSFDDWRSTRTGVGSYDLDAP